MVGLREHKRNSDIVNFSASKTVVQPMNLCTSFPWIDLQDGLGLISVQERHFAPSLILD